MPNAPIENHFEDVNSFISNACQSGGKVLVHCDQGVSRSATAVLAYLMKERGMSVDQAFAYLQSKRGIVDPNYGFIQKLHHYEKSLE